MKDVKKSFLIRFYIVLLMLSLTAEVNLFPLKSLSVQSVYLSLFVFLAGMSFCLIFYRDFLLFLRERRILLLFIGLFLLSGVFSALFSPFPTILGLISLFQYVFFFGVSLLLLFIFSIEKDNIGLFFLNVLVGLAVLLSFVSFFEVTNESVYRFLSDTFRQGENQIINGHVRASATTLHSNVFGCFISLGIIVFICLKSELGIKAKIFYPVIGILSTAAALSGSRNAVSVLLIPLLLLLLNRETAKTALGVLGIAMVALVILTPSSSRFSDIWKVITQSESKYLMAEEEFNTAATRPWLWQSALAMFRDYPLMGIGPGSCNRAMKDYASASLLAHEKEKIDKQYIHAHNGFLNILAEFGLTGAAIALALAVYLIVVLIRRYGLFPPLPIHALMVGIVLSFLPDAFFYSSFYMVIVLTLLLLFAFSGTLGGRAASIPSDKPAS